MNKTGSLILMVILVSLNTVMLAFVFAYGLRQSPYDSVLISIAFSAIALIAWYIIHNVLHELMHLVFALLSGGEIVEFAVMGMRFYKEKGKLKVQFNFRSTYAGYTGFICKTPQKAYKTLYFALYGGFVGTVLTFLIIAVIFSVWTSYYTYYLVLMGAFSVLYMFIINFMCGFKTSDGHLLFLHKSGYTDFANSAIRLEIEGWLYKGKSLSEIDDYTITEMFAEEKQASYYDYLLALETGDLTSADGVLSELERLAENDDNEHIDILLERFFLSCLTFNEELVERDKSICLEIIEEGDTFASLRAHIAYRRFTGEKDWEKLLIESYKKMLDGFDLQGYKKTEMAICDNFIA